MKWRTIEASSEIFYINANQTGSQNISKHLLCAGHCLWMEELQHEYKSQVLSSGSRQHKGESKYLFFKCPKCSVSFILVLEKSVTNSDFVTNPVCVGSRRDNCSYHPVCVGT